MLAIFCLRLAFGLLASLLPLWPFTLNPRFFRAHFLTALGLSVGAFILVNPAADLLWYTLLGGVIVCALGSMTWLLENAPGGRLLILLGTFADGSALFFLAQTQTGEPIHVFLALADNFTSAFFLGSVTTAMLLGHSYLIAPGLTIKPLLRSLLVLGGCLLLRCIVAAAELWSWTNAGPARTLETDVILWLGVRWVVGLIAPLVLGWMAWESARIRSTQSATGILYVAVICVFLGELCGELVLEHMSHALGG